MNADLGLRLVVAVSFEFCGLKLEGDNFTGRRRVVTVGDEFGTRRAIGAVDGRFNVPFANCFATAMALSGVHISAGFPTSGLNVLRGRSMCCPRISKGG